MSENLNFFLCHKTLILLDFCIIKKNCFFFFIFDDRCLKLVIISFIYHYSLHIINYKRSEGKCVKKTAKALK